MTSEADDVAPAGAGRSPGDRLFVWGWMPGATEPVVVGALAPAGTRFGGEAVLLFTYARSYRDRPDAISLFPGDLPLRAGVFDPTMPARSIAAFHPVGPRTSLALHSCLRDAAPDAWGRRVINLRLAGQPEVQLSELTYLAESTSDRIGALDFQRSATKYVARGHDATLDQLQRAAALVDAGDALPPELVAAAVHGTSIGGARPKALLRDGDRSRIAKFGSTSDTRPVVQAESVAMLLAARAGLAVATVDLQLVEGRPVLLVDRFDRGPAGTRRAMVSGLTILGRGELESRYSSYAELATAIRIGPWVHPAAALRELFTRLVFNVCVGNNDDHLRNHAAFWDGTNLELTPAYDLAPQPRSTSVSNQAIGITRDGRRSSQLWLCRAAAADFLLAPAEADAIVDEVVDAIRLGWDDACDAAQLTAAQRESLWQREFLNPYIFFDQP